MTYPIINGVPYPADVVDLDTIEAWLKSIDRPFRESTRAMAGTDIFGDIVGHQEHYFFAPFFEGDAKDKAKALAFCCQTLALKMYWDFVQIPKGAIVIRVPPETDVSRVTNLRHDLTQVKTRKQVEPKGYKGPPIPLTELLPDKTWAVDFMTDVIFKKAENSDNLRLMKIYARYSCAVFAKEEQN